MITMMTMIVMVMVMDKVIYIYGVNWSKTRFYDSDVTFVIVSFECFRYKIH